MPSYPVILVPISLTWLGEPVDMVFRHFPKLFKQEDIRKLDQIFRNVVKTIQYTKYKQMQACIVQELTVTEDLKIVKPPTRKRK